MAKNNFTWKIGGEAGMGIKAAGQMMSKLFTRAGLFSIGYTEYPSLIRGGHNNYLLRVSDMPITSYNPEVDVLVALDANTVEVNKGIVRDGGFVLYESGGGKVDVSKYEDGYSGVTFVDVSMTDIVKEVSGPTVMRNTVALAASLAVLGADLEFLTTLLAEQFGSKGDKIVATNVEVAQKGFDVVAAQGIESGISVVPAEREEEYLVTNGNDALALGAVRGGLTFYSAYPMTPATSLLHFFAAHERETGMVVKHTEDEIAAVLMAIGASVTGARSMVGTSGGGFSLMVESLGLAAITETPLVVVLAQRPGPATGLPTWTGQADLRFAMHAAQDEFLRVVIAPGDAEECFVAGAHALQLAEKYHLPVIVMTDTYLAEQTVSVPMFDQENIQVTRESFASDEALSKFVGGGDEDSASSDAGAEYHRYAVSGEFALDHGVTARSVPGQAGGRFLLNSDEHDEWGFSEESAENRVVQHDKRWAKLEGLMEELPTPSVYGDPGADVAIMTWGSTKGAALQAQLELAEIGITTVIYHTMYVAPFPKAFYEGQALDPDRTLFVEGNRNGQFAGVFREHTGFPVSHRLNKYDGRPVYPFEIVRAVREIVGDVS